MAAQATTKRLSEDFTGSRTGDGSESEATDTVLSNYDTLKMIRGVSKTLGKRPSSPIKLPTSSGHDQQAPIPNTEILSIQLAAESILLSGSIVFPMRTDVMNEYCETAPQPFQSISKPLDPFQTKFSANDPHVSVNELKFYCRHYAVSNVDIC